jgi:hypothetical protein
VSCFWCARIHHAKHALSVCPTCMAGFSTMRLLEMNGSYPLDGGSIDALLPRTSPGNYALGYMHGGVFEVFYVGRSDSDVRQRLHEWVGKPSSAERFACCSASWGARRLQVLAANAPALDRVVNGGSSYTHFAYSYAATANAAFDKQCRNYDDFGGSRRLDNHARPRGPRSSRKIRSRGES